jgi:hypothetical protein
MDRTLRAGAIVLVSGYMIAVGLWLMVTGRIPVQPALHYARSWLRRRRRGALAEIQEETGYCWIARVDSRMPSDAEALSRLRLFEDDRQLGPAHALHDDIRTQGGGRYSHWGHQVYFSTFDNSDPRTNGRTYRYREV